MKVTIRLKINEAPAAQIKELASLLTHVAEWKLYPDGRGGWMTLDVPENDADYSVFRDYCHHHHIRIWVYRGREYSKREMDSAPYLFFTDHPADVNANENTAYTNKDCCPKCGAGLEQGGPLTFPLNKVRKKKLFCVELRNSHEWVVSSEIKPLFDGLTGFRWGEVVDMKTGRGSPLFHQIVIENHLPRTATITNFIEHDPPLKNRCGCNRAGWNLQDVLVYEQAALKDAKDFNRTIERWYGGGPCGNRWPVVSQAVHSQIRKARLLSNSCFEPVQIIEKDPGTKHKFDLPLDVT